MKNLFLIPTEKPSRLVYEQRTFIRPLMLKSEPISETKDSLGQLIHEPQNIYITSDEQIKERDWVIKLKNNTNDYSNSTFKKIILTTDKDLIKNGVQAIDDSFLEWFIKNPTCEEIKVNKLYYGALSGFADAGYKLIIPQEETKQSVQEYEQQGLEKSYSQLERETLEEVAERLWLDSTSQLTSKSSFIQGANWQAERSYSEEEVISLLNDFAQHLIFSKNSDLNLIEWFEQIKKK
jgi:hypothetical protein